MGACSQCILVITDVSAFVFVVLCVCVCEVVQEHFSPIQNLNVF